MEQKLIECEKGKKMKLKLSEIGNKKYVKRKLTSNQISEKEKLKFSERKC